MEKFNSVSGLYEDEGQPAPYVYNTGSGKHGQDIPAMPAMPAMPAATLVKPNKLLLYGVLAALAVVLYPQLKRSLRQITR